jgi:ubiquinone/menaquinone biosynthesis C-methylase UbiE
MPFIEWRAHVSERANVTLSSSADPLDAQRRVVHYYDTHPINEHEILSKVEKKRGTLDGLTQDDLKEFDQDHYDGYRATDLLIEAADIRRVHRVLDVCCGLGGPARWVAHRIGCHVTGLDLTPSRVDSARRLADRVGLSHLVEFVQGDATRMPFADATFDRAYGQEAWIHIADKASLLAQCRRVLTSDGVLAFTDIVSIAPLTASESAQMADEMQFPTIVTAQQYLDLLPAAGFAIQRHDDLSPAWRDILVGRLEMYRSLRDTTIERFGQPHFEKWDRMYSAFVALYVAGKLGGARIVARAR